MGCGQGGVAVVSGSQDDLLGVFPPQVTDNENSRKVSFALFIGLDVAVVIHPDAGRNQLVIGTEADEDEHAIHGQFPGGSSLSALESYGVDAGVIGFHFDDDGIPEDVDLRFGQDPLLQNPAAPEGVPAVGQVNPPGDFGEIKGLFQSGIASSYRQ